MDSRLMRKLYSQYPILLTPPKPEPLLGGYRRPSGENTDLFKLDAHPVVALGAYVEVSLAVADVADLLVLVEMLVEEHADLALVNIAHLGRGHGDLVAVLIVPLASQRIHAGQFWDAVVQHAELPQLLLVDVLARVVWQALIALLL